MWLNLRLHPLDAKREIEKGESSLINWMLPFMPLKRHFISHLVKLRKSKDFVSIFGSSTAILRWKEKRRSMQWREKKSEQKWRKWKGICYIFICSAAPSTKCLSFFCRVTLRELRILCEGWFQSPLLLWFLTLWIISDSHSESVSNLMKEL